MQSRHSTAASLALIGGGALAWALAGQPLVKNKELDAPLNILGINHSPYGEVLAMAMQSSIDSTYHRGMDTTGTAHAGDSAEEARGELTSMKEDSPQGSGNIRNRFRGFLDYLAASSTARTNSRPLSKAHDLHIRGKVEDQLKFAYNLDPANYGNYASYHFFLTEPAIGTRRILTPEAAKLAEDTIAYCLREPRDPRPALTAAAAATNVLHLMFEDRRSEKPFFTVPQMRHALGVLDHCLARHHELTGQWEASGEKALLSSMRIAEMEDRLSFILKIRAAAETTIQRFESETDFGHQTSTP